MTRTILDGQALSVAPTLGSFTSFGKEITELVQNLDFVRNMLLLRKLQYLSLDRGRKDPSDPHPTATDSWFPFDRSKVKIGTEKIHPVMEVFWRILREAQELRTCSRDESHYNAFSRFVTDLLEKQALLVRRAKLKALHTRREVGNVL